MDGIFLAVRAMAGPGLRVRWLCLGCLVLLGAAGCISRQGPALRDFAPARSPHGVTAVVNSSWGRLTGELLEVMDSGLLLLEAGGVAVVPWEAISGATFQDVPVTLGGGVPPSTRNRERLRLVSRYVPGLTHEQRQALLQHHGQDRPLRSPLPPRDGDEAEGAALGHGGAHGGGPDGGGGHPSPANGDGAADLVRAVAQAVERFRDPEEAMLSGYRPLGPDFPGMGVHWVHGPYVMAGGLDPRRPAVLTYLETPAGTLLTGAAFVRVLGPGESPPDTPFPGAWHEHAGSVDEETLALNPHVRGHPDPHEARVTMLHVWTGLENPDGAFAQDNWAVPFARLGLPVPAGASPAAGKALFLASGGDAYYERLILLLAAGDSGAPSSPGPLSPSEKAGVARALADARAQVEARLHAEDPARVEDGMEPLASFLETVWSSLWDAIEASVGPSTWERIAVLRP